MIAVKLSHLSLSISLYDLSFVKFMHLLKTRARGKQRPRELIWVKISFWSEDRELENSWLVGEAIKSLCAHELCDFYFSKSEKGLSW